MLLNLVLNVAVHVCAAVNAALGIG